MRLGRRGGFRLLLTSYTVSVAVEDVGSASVVMTVDGFTGDSYNEVKETVTIEVT